MKSVYKYNNEPEAQKIKSLLESENIPCEIHSFENWGYDGAFRGQIGMGEVIVPDKFSVKAKEIINKYIEESSKNFKEDAESKSIKLKRDVEKLKTLIYYLYMLFVVFSLFLAYRMRNVLSAVIITLLAIGIYLVTTRLQKDLKKTQKELEKLTQ